MEFTIYQGGDLLCSPRSHLEPQFADWRSIIPVGPEAAPSYLNLNFGRPMGFEPAEFVHPVYCACHDQLHLVVREVRIPLVPYTSWATAVRLKIEQNQLVRVPE
jgi:hypothetical protein